MPAGGGRQALAHRNNGRAAAVDRHVLRSGGVHGPFHAPRPRGAPGADPDLSQGLWRCGRALRRPCRPVPGGRTADLLRLAQGLRGRGRARGPRGPGDRAGGQCHQRGVQALGPRGPDHRNRGGWRAIPRRQHRGEAGRRGGTQSRGPRHEPRGPGPGRHSAGDPPPDRRCLCAHGPWRPQPQGVRRADPPLARRCGPQDGGSLRRRSGREAADRPGGA